MGKAVTQLVHQDKVSSMWYSGYTGERCTECTIILVLSRPCSLIVEHQTVSEGGMSQSPGLIG